MIYVVVLLALCVAASAAAFVRGGYSSNARAADDDRP